MGVGRVELYVGVVKGGALCGCGEGWSSTWVW